jgi:hypothetical protein
VHYVEEIFFHPKASSSKAYDVALIKVILPFTFTGRVQPKELQSDLNDAKIGATCVLAGYGKTLVSYYNRHKHVCNF